MNREYEGFIEEAIRDMVALRAKELVGEVRQKLPKCDAEPSLLTELQEIFGQCYEEGLKNGVQLAGLAEEIETYRTNKEEA